MAQRFRFIEVTIFARFANIGSILDEIGMSTRFRPISGNFNFKKKCSVNKF